MMPESDGLNLFLSFVLPALLGFISVLVAQAVTRRSQREQNQNTGTANETTQFEAITNALFKRVEALEKTVKSLEDANAEAKAALALKDRENDLILDELADMRRVNGALIRYIKKLTRAWPNGTTLPSPDEPLDIDGK